MQDLVSNPRLEVWDLDYVSSSDEEDNDSDEDQSDDIQEVKEELSQNNNDSDQYKILPDGVE